MSPRRPRGGAQPNTAPPSLQHRLGEDLPASTLFTPFTFTIQRQIQFLVLLQRTKPWIASKYILWVEIVRSLEEFPSLDAGTLDTPFLINYLKETAGRWQQTNGTSAFFLPAEFSLADAYERGRKSSLVESIIVSYRYETSQNLVEHLDPRKVVNRLRRYTVSYVNQKARSATSSAASSRSRRRESRLTDSQRRARNTAGILALQSTALYYLQEPEYSLVPNHSGPNNGQY
ncbi:hypothetical protein HDU76_003413 [Blyttiomyces sp. JEL0837]|nr:hypothetical protein HDU76_003413 [Blyttiomyces sp. JEL0837]